MNCFIHECTFYADCKLKETARFCARCKHRTAMRAGTKKFVDNAPSPESLKQGPGRKDGAVIPGAVTVVACALLCCGSLSPGHVSGGGGGGGGQGGGTETTNSVVHGTFYEPDGVTPATGIDVHVRPRSTLGDTTVDLSPGAFDTAHSITDNQGAFVIDTLTPDIYVVEADDGAGHLALIDSVAVAGTTSPVEVADTLRPPGAIRGKVVLSQGGDPRRVLVLAFGLDRFALPGADGTFLFSDLAQGNYDIRILPLLPDRPEYDVLDTAGVSVTAGDTTDLGDLYVHFAGVKAPRSLSADCDTAMRVVTLRWRPSADSSAAGYNVFRKDLDSLLWPPAVNSSPVRDTFFQDSSVRQGHSYAYRITAISPSGTESRPGDTVQMPVVSPYLLLKSLGEPEETDPGHLGMIVSGDTIYLTESYHGRVVMLDTAGEHLKVFEPPSDEPFMEPRDIAMHNDRLYVVDRTERIRLYDRKGDFLGSITLEGATLRDVAVASDDSIYVADEDGERVVLVDGDGAVQAVSTYSFTHIGRVETWDSVVVATDRDERTLLLMSGGLSTNKEITVISRQYATGGSTRKGVVLGAVSSCGGGHAAVALGLVATEIFMLDLLEGKRIARFVPIGAGEDGVGVNAIRALSSDSLWVALSNGEVHLYRRW